MKANKRVLLISMYYEPEIGAPQVRFRSMVAALAAHGYTIEVITALPNYPKGQIFSDYRGRFSVTEKKPYGVVHRVWIYSAMGSGVKRLLNYLSFAFLSLVFLRKVQRPSFVIVESPPLFVGWTGWMYSRLLNSPMILNVADLWPDSIRDMGMLSDGFVFRCLRKLEDWIYKKSYLVNGVTEGIRKTLVEKKGLAQSKVTFLPNGVDLTVFKPNSQGEEAWPELDAVFSRKKHWFVYPGTIGLAQGLDVMLRALKRIELTPLGKDVGFLIVGDGSDRQRLKDLARDLGLSQVQFVDMVPPEKIPVILKKAFAGFVSLKNIPLFEGARPSKLMPIMACGKPVLYSGAGEGARVVEQARAGYTVPPENDEALAQAILTMVENEGATEALGAEGRKFVEKHYSWDHLVKEWLKEVNLSLQRSSP